MISCELVTLETRPCLSANQHLNEGLKKKII